MADFTEDLGMLMVLGADFAVLFIEPEAVLGVDAIADLTETTLPSRGTASNTLTQLDRVSTFLNVIVENLKIVVMDLKIRFLSPSPSTQKD